MCQLFSQLCVNNFWDPNGTGVSGGFIPVWDNKHYPKTTIHQRTTTLSTSKNVEFPGPNHRCWGLDTLIITLIGTRVTIKVLGYLVVRTWK